MKPIAHAVALNRNKVYANTNTKNQTHKKQQLKPKSKQNTMGALRLRNTPMVHICNMLASMKYFSISSTA